ncbi:MAG: hypothetical protein PHU95_07445, partial [Candidatus Thermoplasmatota archaeon]|nr:hypothetical protein [Candidatus Thermoplasmatota archaeon]
MRSGLHEEAVAAADGFLSHAVVLGVEGVGRADVGVPDETEEVGGRRVLKSQGLERVGGVEGIEDVFVRVRGGAVKEGEGILDGETLGERKQTLP